MTFNCERHGDYEGTEIKFCGRLIPSACPVCMAERERLAREQDERLHEELKKEYERHERALLIERGIEPEFFGVTLEDYKAETEDERAALTAAYELAEGKIKKLVLLGNFGTGKTMLASALAIKLGGIRITMFELSAKIRACFNNREGSEIDVLDKLLENKFIAIDELGRTKGSEAELNWLSYLIDKAHSRGIKLMLISNKRQAKNLPKERVGESFEMFLPNDSISRLRQDTRIIELYGRDRRA